MFTGLLVKNGYMRQKWEKLLILFAIFYLYCRGGGRIYLAHEQSSGEIKVALGKF